MSVDELIDDFQFLDDWEDKYKYVIELGQSLPPLDSKFRSEEWRVDGCTSQVWLVPEVNEVDGEKFLSFKADSDAIIVRGLLAIILLIFSNKSVKDIKKIAVDDIFVKLGLEEHLTPSRRNGLFSMVEKIKYYAEHL